MLHNTSDKSYPKMSTTQSVLLRSSIVLGMVAAVMTVIYFTPMPDQNFKSCDRPCHALDWPMICRIKINIEKYQTMSGSCINCTTNSTNCDTQHCVTADGNLREILTANRQLPGPSIQICQNDILVIDVVNKLQGQSVSIHWRGQSNSESPSMDGVPMVTQCPIMGYTTFQYRFRASTPGTHFYHAHSDSQRSDGLFGSLIVRKADELEPHKKLYDVDSKDHVLLISEWSERMSYGFDTPKISSILINGKTSAGVGGSSFLVERGKRYRFRVAYTSGASGCPVNFKIDKHLIRVIALDGGAVVPYEVNSVTLTKGERFDFVLKANQEDGSYFVRARSNCSDNLIEGISLLTYENSVNNLIRVDPEEKDTRILNTGNCENRLGVVCLTNVKSVNKIPVELRRFDVDKKIYLGFNKTSRNVEGGWHSLTEDTYQVNNLTFTYPPSPLLTQQDEIPRNIICNQDHIPAECSNRSSCECVHIEKIPLGNTVEVLLLDQGGESEEYIFHLHGYQFYIVGMRTLQSSTNIEEIKKLDREDKLLKRNFNSPVLKDTVRISRNGVVAFRFVASNPGFWILRDEQSKGWTRGLDVVFQVGEISDMPSIPTNFPTCGNYIGPDFFFI